MLGLEKVGHCLWAVIPSACHARSSEATPEQPVRQPPPGGDDPVFFVSIRFVTGRIAEVGDYGFESSGWSSIMSTVILTKAFYA